MSSRNNKNTCTYSNTLGKITTSLIVIGSVLVIATSLFSKKKTVSYERLRRAYDGLSPRDYYE
jgi:hypothetical protein